MSTVVILLIDFLKTMKGITHQLKADATALDIGGKFFLPKEKTKGFRGDSNLQLSLNTTGYDIYFTVTIQLALRGRIRHEPFDDGLL